MLVHIDNCNNIKSANIDLQEQKMNIFFGRNGSGKSTIAKAIALVSEGKGLEALRPYGKKSTANQPTVTGVTNEKIMVFNDEYVKTYVYQKNTIIQNAFDVLVRTPEYDAAKQSIDIELHNLKTVIIDDDSVVELMGQLQLLLGKIKVGSNQQLDRRSAKGILEGKGAFFNPPKELEEMKPFLMMIVLQNGQIGECKDTSSLVERDCVHIVQQMMMKKRKEEIKFFLKVLIKVALKLLH